MKQSIRRVLATGLFFMANLAWADRVWTPGVIVSTPTSDARAIADLDELDAPVKLVEQEFDAALLENLAAPETPPSQVKLPPLVAESGQWRGSLSGVTRPARVVLRNPVTWDKLWSLAIRPYSRGLPETPPVDFAKEMVVGVFMGERQNPGYVMEILSARPDRFQGERVLLVRYKIASKMQAVFNPPFPVQPFHLKKVPAFSGRVHFLEIKR